MSQKDEARKISRWPILRGNSKWMGKVWAGGSSSLVNLNRVCIWGSWGAFKNTTEGRSLDN